MDKDSLSRSRRSCRCGASLAQLALLTALVATGSVCGSAGGPSPADAGGDAAAAPDATASDALMADDRPPGDAAVDRFATDADLDATSAALFADVQAIFDAHCTICHDASKQGLPTDPMLPLTADASYAALVGHPAEETCGGTRVVPGNSADSYLIHKLTDVTPCEGVQMPRGFEIIVPPPLDVGAIAIIRRWIDAGAPR
jgi:cytochrome c5